MSPDKKVRKKVREKVREKIREKIREKRQMLNKKTRVTKSHPCLICIV